MIEAAPWKLPAKIAPIFLLLPSERWEKKQPSFGSKTRFPAHLKSSAWGPRTSQSPTDISVSSCLSAAVYLVQSQTQLEQWPPQGVTVTTPQPVTQQRIQQADHLPIAPVPSSATDRGSSFEEFSCSFCTSVCHLKVGIVPFSFQFQSALSVPAVPQTPALCRLSLSCTRQARSLQ